jgi:hypothetical protein
MPLILTSEDTEVMKLCNQIEQNWQAGEMRV